MRDAPVAGGMLPLREHVPCVSGRLSFELVQKAAVAGSPVLVAVGAPSSLAVELGRDVGVTLCGFAREGRLSVYSEPWRCESAPARTIDAIGTKVQDQLINDRSVMAMLGTDRRWRGRPAVWLIACIVLAVVTAVVLGAARPAAADSPETAVLDWNKHALDALANATGAPTPGSGMAAPVQLVHLAMVQGAVYDAVNSIAGGYEPYLDVPASPGTASNAAAAATAAHDVLVAVLNEAPLTATFTATVRAAIITRLDFLLADSIAAATAAEGATAVAAGIDAGEAAAAAMIAERAGDGRWGPFRFTCGQEPGQWRPVTSLVCTTPSGPSDPFAWVAKVEPFVVESNEQFLSNGPPALNTGLYAKEYNEVKALGATGSARTAEQQALFAFFQANPVEMYNRTFRTYALQQGLDLAEQARLFALLGLSGADTAINCWEDKAHWSNWRPQAAIRLGDDDGNPNTHGDPLWTSAVGTPPYPDASSGYNCVTGSFMEIAELYFGHGQTTFVLAHPTGMTREYRHFRDVCDDTIDARIYQGIHFRSADELGARLGRDVARWVDKHALQPVK